MHSLLVLVGVACTPVLAHVQAQVMHICVAIHVLCVANKGGLRAFDDEGNKPPKARRELYIMGVIDILQVTCHAHHVHVNIHITHRFAALHVLMHTCVMLVGVQREEDAGVNVQEYTLQQEYHLGDRITRVSGHASMDMC